MFDCCQLYAHFSQTMCCRIPWTSPELYFSSYEHLKYKGDRIIEPTIAVDPYVFSNSFVRSSDPIFRIDSRHIFINLLIAAITMISKSCFLKLPKILLPRNAALPYSQRRNICHMGISGFSRCFCHNSASFELSTLLHPHSFSFWLL